MCAVAKTRPKPKAKAKKKAKPKGKRNVKTLLVGREVNFKTCGAVPIAGTVLFRVQAVRVDDKPPKKPKKKAKAKKPRRPKAVEAAEALPVADSAAMAPAS